MTARIAVGLPSTDERLEKRDPPSPYPSYWNEENHTSSESANTYLRAEEWLKDLGDFSLPVRNTSVSITLAMGEAIMRYREELKMYAAILDQNNSNRLNIPEPPLTPAMEDISFLDERHQIMKSDWPAGKERAVWWHALEELRLLLDKQICDMPEGAFIKLSVRSPKDAAALMPSYKQLITEHIRERSNVMPDSIDALGADVSAIKYAAWKAMRCTTGEEAVLLLVRSDRIYIDILQHELFCRGTGHQQKQSAFDLKVHVFEFFSGFDPDWEFRAFMSNGSRTAITIYNPWVYSADMLNKKEQILALLLEVWDKADGHIRSENYSLDFAVSPDLSACWIVELNNFLPPLAGCGVFNFYDEEDRKVLLEGPFEFRLKKAPVTEADFSRVHINADAETGQEVKVTVNMQPASPDVMLYAANARRAKYGLLPEHSRKLKDVLDLEMEQVTSGDSVSKKAMFYSPVIDVNPRKLFFYPVSPSTFAYFHLLRKAYEIAVIFLSSDMLFNDTIQTVCYVYATLYFSISFIFVPLYQNITFVNKDDSLLKCKLTHGSLSSLDWTAGSADSSPSPSSGMDGHQQSSLSYRCSPRFRSDDEDRTVTRFVPFSTYNYYVMLTRPGKELNPALPDDLIEFGGLRAYFLFQQLTTLGIFKAVLLINAVYNLTYSPTAPMGYFVAIGAFLGTESTILAFAFTLICLPYVLATLAYPFLILVCPHQLNRIVNPPKDTMMFDMFTWFWNKAALL